MSAVSHVGLLALSVSLLALGGCGGSATTDRSGAQTAATVAPASTDAGSGADAPSAAPSAATAKVAARTEAIAASPVYRFYNTRTAAHFYTFSQAERDLVRATQPHMGYDGPAFYAAGQNDSGFQPVYRFFNATTGVHFYTISEAEKSAIESSLPQFRLEGVAYRASITNGVGLMPLYRFYLAGKGFHFYTTSDDEVAYIRGTLPQYTYEGVAYYVPNPNPSALVAPLGGELPWSVDSAVAVVLSGPFGAPLTGAIGCSSTNNALAQVAADCTRAQVRRLDARHLVRVSGSGVSVDLPLSAIPQRQWSGRHGATDGYGMVVTADGRSLVWSGSHASYNQVLAQGVDRPTLPYVTVPLAVKSASGSGPLGAVVQASGGHGSALAVTRGGNVSVWGENYQCAAGVGSQYPGEFLLPVSVRDSAGTSALARVVQAEKGGLFNVALQDDGQAVYWGSPALPDAVGMRCLPGQVPGVNGVGRLSNLVQVSASNGYALALTAAGTVVALGSDGGRGRLGSGAVINTPAPGWPNTVKKADGSELDHIVQVSAGYSNGMALADDGTVWIWGAGETIGTTSTGARPAVPHAVLVAGLSGISMVAAGGFHNYALDAQGRVWSWGTHGAHGVLGDGKPAGQDNPRLAEDQARAPALVVGLSGALSVAASYSGGSALMPDGRVLNWGSNFYAGLGQGVDHGALGTNWNTTDGFSPVPLRNETNTGSLVLNPPAYPNLLRRAR